MSNPFEKTRFDLEEQIMDCWNVTKDLEYVLKMTDAADYTEDDLANILIGMQTLYNRKFDALFSTFEYLIRERKIT